MQVNLDGYPLPVKKLKGTDPVESLHFSEKRLGPVSAIVIGALIHDNASLTQLDLSANYLCGLDNFGRGTYNATGIKAIADWDTVDIQEVMMLPLHLQNEELRHHILYY